MGGAAAAAAAAAWKPCPPPCTARRVLSPGSISRAREKRSQRGSSEIMPCDSPLLSISRSVSASVSASLSRLSLPFSDACRAAPAGYPHYSNAAGKHIWSTGPRAAMRQFTR
jgi:hypothetical protein